MEPTPLALEGGGPVDKTPHCQCQGQSIQSLVGELGSHMPHGMAKKKKKEKIEIKAHCEETKQWTNLDLEVIYLLKLDGDIKISVINMLNAPTWKR